MEVLNSLILCEFYTATLYLDRLLFALTEIEKMHLTPRGKMQMQKMCFEFSNFCHESINPSNAEDHFYIYSNTEFKNHLKQFHQLFESMIKLPLQSMSITKKTIDYINLIYRHAFEIHNIVNELTPIDIQLPKIGLIQSENIPNINGRIVPLYSLNEEHVTSISKMESIQKSPLSFLELKRDEKYVHYLERGHFFINEKNYLEAKTHFLKARNYKESAEILTLIAWSCSLLDDIKEAKSFCMMAIQKDSQYGPAYNDFGTYILNEGQVKESLRWFELAKRAYNYQNREYPYINAGRAYVLLKQDDAGLKEFSLALTLAPHHQELHETVIKLKNNIDREMPPPTIS